MTSLQKVTLQSINLDWDTTIRPRAVYIFFLKRVPPFCVIFFILFMAFPPPHKEGGRTHGPGPARGGDQTSPVRSRPGPAPVPARPGPAPVPVPAPVRTRSRYRPRSGPGPTPPVRLRTGRDRPVRKEQITLTLIMLDHAFLCARRESELTRGADGHSFYTPGLYYRYFYYRVNLFPNPPPTLRRCLFF